MRWAVVLLPLACACDRALGLGATQLADAALAIPDAMPMCPQIGTTAPAFAGAAVSLGAKLCEQYSVSATTDTAMAVCDAGRSIAVGSIGEMTLMSADIDLSALQSTIEARIAPEGDFAIVMGYDGAHGAIMTFARDASGRWTAGTDVDRTSIFTSQITGPSRRGDRRVLALETFGGPQTMVEYSDGGTGSWHVVHQTDPTTLVANAIDSMNLTEDGMRLVLHDGTVGSTYFTDRQSLDDDFRAPALAMDTVPTASRLFPYMSEDCGRLYISGLGQNFVIFQ